MQKQLPDYGKFEKGNKISYDDLHIYLDRLYGFKNYNFKEIILPKMKKITTDVKKGRGLYADPDRLREQLCKCCLTRPISRDLVVQLIREVDTNGEDHLEIQDFLMAMNVKDTG